MIESFFQVGDKAILVHQNLADGRLRGLEDPKSPMGEHIPVDYFAGLCWDYVRHEAMEKALYIRRHGPFMPATLPPEEMEYTTKVEVLKKLKPRKEEID